MRRVGLVTFHGQNYGSVLQCYATKCYLESVGILCDVLNMRTTGTEAIEVKLRSAIRLASASIRHPSLLQARREMLNAAHIAADAMSSDSREMLDLFEYSVLRPKDVSWRLLADERFTDAYEYFISGSDQVWGAAVLPDRFFLLEFAEPGKRVALAASFGVGTLKPYNRDEFAREISKYEYLSVRERSGQAIVKEISGRNVPILSDPVVLLTPKEWMQFSKSGLGRTGDPYVFVHFLDHPSAVACETIRLLAKERGLAVVVFAYPQPEFDDLAHIEFVDGSPVDYISLISNASYVCTDSFHTTQFSIIFNRNFLVFERMYAHSYSQSSRLETVLWNYGCQERLIKEASYALKVLQNTASNFDDKRRKEREKLIGYLDNVLM